MHLKSHLRHHYCHFRLDILLLRLSFLLDFPIKRFVPNYQLIVGRNMTKVMTKMNCHSIPVYLLLAAAVVVVVVAAGAVVHRSFLVDQSYLHRTKYQIILPNLDYYSIHDYQMNSKYQTVHLRCCCHHQILQARLNRDFQANSICLRIRHLKQHRQEHRLDRIMH